MKQARLWIAFGIVLAFSTGAAAQGQLAPADPLLPVANADPLTPMTNFDCPPADDEKLLGLIAHSDDGFNCFISPMSNPVYFEDPRTLSEARMIFANHALPNSLGGGSVQLYAMQLRAALTENLSFIATKDGFFISESPLLNDGFADVNAGLKYNLFKDYETQTMVSAGFTYEIPLGSPAALQGRGTGEFNFFVNGGKQIGEYWHALTAFGVRAPTDNNVQNQSLYWSSHLDRQLGDSGLYLFTECNWYHWMSSANYFPAQVEGLDLFNLGSTNVTGNNIVTGAYGLKYKPNPKTEIGVVYEIPYTARRDIIQDRLMVDLIIRY